MIEKLNNNEGVKRSETAAGQRELVREHRNTINELIDAVNDLQETVYGSENDDLCPDCRFDMVLDTLPDLDEAQLEEIIDTAEGLLEERSQEGMKEGIEDDDLDDSESVYHKCALCDTKMTGDPVLCPDCQEKEREGQDHPGGISVTKDDGALFEIVKMCVTNPDIRLGQAICNVSGYNKAWLEDEKGELHDLWQWNGEKVKATNSKKTTKGPKE